VETVVPVDLVDLTAQEEIRAPTAFRVRVASVVAAGCLARREHVADAAPGADLASWVALDPWVGMAHVAPPELPVIPVFPAPEALLADPALPGATATMVLLAALDVVAGDVGPLVPLVILVSVAALVLTACPANPAPWVALDDKDLAATPASMGELVFPALSGPAARSPPSMRSTLPGFARDAFSAVTAVVLVFGGRRARGPWPCGCTLGVGPQPKPRPSITRSRACPTG